MASFISCKLLIFVLVLGYVSVSCYGHKTFGFDMHHRYSDAVKDMFPGDDLPEKGSLDYYSVMVHRDRILHGRRLSSTVNQSLLTFVHGNKTLRFNSLGFLHYANVSVGTPSLSFLAALDTGSDLFWLPCECTTSCVHGLVTTSGQQIPLNIYSPNMSTTSTSVPCNSSLCQNQGQCTATPETCPYQVEYLSANTSSSGLLVEDVLHLITDDKLLKPVDVPVTLGCGMVQTGSFLDGASPNGLFGLGIEAVSVPSILTAKGLASNSFSMCFGDRGIGRITFGDKGSPGQGQTPFNLKQLHPSYNVSITQVIIGQKTTEINFTAIVDTGTSFTYLSDPVYSLIAKNFDSQVLEKRVQYNLSIPFEYCYEISATQTNLSAPIMNLTMAGGDNYYVADSLILFSLKSGGAIYCLAILKSDDIDIIGQNFMTGYTLVFDREKMVLGWKESNCYDQAETTVLPISPSSSPTEAPTAPVNPQATPRPTSSGSNNSTTSPSPSSNDSSRFTQFSYLSIMILFFSHCLIIFS